MMILQGITEARQWFPRVPIEGVYQQQRDYYFKKIKLCPGDYIIRKNQKSIVFRVNHGVVNG